MEWTIGLILCCDSACVFTAFVMSALYGLFEFVQKFGKSNGLFREEELVVKLVLTIKAYTNSFPIILNVVAIHRRFQIVPYGAVMVFGNIQYRLEDAYELKCTF